MPSLRRIRSHTRLLTLAGTLALAVGQTGCATSGAMQNQMQSHESLVFENSSPDLVRVSLYAQGHEVVLGRVIPSARVALPLRRGMVPPESDAVCVVVVPVGGPSVTKPSAQSASAIRSELYPVSELTRWLWTYSGSRVLVARLPHDVRGDNGPGSRDGAEQTSVRR